MLYYQKTRSIEDYLDEFIDLIIEAGYTDPKTTVVKFQKGLDSQIQNAIATMAYGCLSDTFPDGWYEVAKNIDQNCATNDREHHELTCRLIQIQPGYFSFKNPDPEPDR